MKNKNTWSTRLRKGREQSRRKRKKRKKKRVVEGGWKMRGCVGTGGH